MSNSVPVSNAYRPPRRSTRINQAVALTVQGLDSFRAPYNEQVSTLSLNCHGCRYISKYDVLPSSWVTLELKDEKKESKPVSVRGRVKWVKRAPDTGNGQFQTAVELDNPGNVWGIASPPADWLPFCGPRTIETDTSKPKPFAIPKPEPAAAVAKQEKQDKVFSPLDKRPATPLSVKVPSTGQLMGQFQQQMEAMLAEAAATAVQERAASALDEMRAEVREESKHIVAETIASQAGPWIENALKQLKHAGVENARTMHGQWTKKLEADVQQALGRIELRRRELEELSQNLAANTLERVQEVLEASRKDAVDRIVARLKEQIAPQLEHAKKVTAELTQRNEQLEKLQGESLEKFSSRIEKACAGFEKQFEAILRERLDSAREALERVGSESTAVMLKNLRASSERQDAQAQAHLQGELNRVAEATLAKFKTRVEETSKEFAGELGDYSRSHLEYVGGAISELAKGIGKPSKS
jgi:hypothetical protein